MTLSDPEIARMVSRSGAILNGDIDYLKLTDAFEKRYEASSTSFPHKDASS